MPAGEILYAGTPGMRERSGVAGTVPTFVLEAEPAATAPLTRLFGVRTLEDALEWNPEHGECPFDATQMDEVREGLRALLPPLLARIRVERTNANDTRVLTEFVERVEPVARAEPHLHARRGAARPRGRAPVLRRRFAAAAPSRVRRLGRVAHLAAAG